MDIVPDIIKEEAARLRDSAGKFMDTYSRFMAIGPDVQQDAALADKWASTRSLAEKTRSSIEYANSLVGSFFTSAAPLYKASGLNGLGIFPVVIPVAVAAVSAAVAAVIYATTKMLEVIGANDRRNQILAINRDRVAAGQAPLNPDSLGGSDPTVSGNIQSMIKWGAVAALAIIVLPKLLGNKNDN